MSLQDLDVALAIIAANPDSAYFAGPKSAELIRRAEEALGLSLPPTYRKFVAAYGAGSELTVIDGLPSMLLVHVVAVLIATTL